MSFWDDAGSVLAQVAPGIATALGGPVAGLAVKALTGALGLGDNASKEDVMKAVANATPEQLAAIKKAEQDFMIRMKELDIDVYELDQKDRDSARRRQVDMDDWTPNVLGGVIIAGFFIIVAMVLAGQFAVETALAGTLVGYVSAKAEQVVAFFFGSSKGSKDKTKAMSDAFQKTGKFLTK